MSYRKHHKHSFQLIMHAERLGLPARERAIVALVSRYHRKTGPAKKHEEFAALSPGPGHRRRMSGLLRVADGLDRGHTAAVEMLTTELTDDELTIRIVPRLARPTCPWSAGARPEGGRAGETVGAGCRGQRGIGLEGLTPRTAPRCS